MDSIRELRIDELPPLLTEINDPPKKLYIRGTFSTAEKYLTIVGTRKPSVYGKEVCEMLIKDLRGLPVAIVSGLALGIDALAHQTAIENDIATIAVPGSGLGDTVLYPASNKHIVKKIIENDGCLLSEYGPDFKATVWSFPRRNRIMAGLSHATLVIEAEAKSGTLITSKLATEYNRDVLTVPGSIFSNNSEGPHLLIRLGATPITCADDLREALGFEKTETKPLWNKDDLSAEEICIVDALVSPLSRDELADVTEMNTAELNSLLTLMEIKGIVKESGGEIHLV
ncbi:MAG TPA: DNA-processing protein DprA [Candidatus Paceibacterota bacterium]|nr:DNA-processing protein DprA [Candidatus Paceibacterota bacterium]